MALTQPQFVSDLLRVDAPSSYSHYLFLSPIPYKIKEQGTAVTAPVQPPLVAKERVMACSHTTTQTQLVQDTANTTGVYQWKNLVNGKVYVGSSAKSLSGRKASHITALENNTHENLHFQRAWNKYGKDSFEFAVLEECSPEQVLLREQYWMDFFKVTDRRYGYNKAPLAGSNLGVRHSQEIRDKVSVRSRARWQDPVYRAKVSKTQKRIQKVNQNRPEMKAVRSIKSKEIKSI